MELSRWLHDRTGAYDWTHTSAAAAELEGNRDQHQEKESRLKSSIKQILKCDFEEENITSPVVLPLADCVHIAWLLENISKNGDEYMRKLKKSLKLLKPGGHLLLFTTIDMTYFTVGGERFCGFPHDEAFVKNVISKLGLVIDYFTVQRRRNVSHLIDYRAVMFTVAHKAVVSFPVSDPLSAPDLQAAVSNLPNSMLDLPTLILDLSTLVPES
ncbi:indolethylamine N-methyltransferase-like [Mantella aurantiaca]